MPRDVSELSRVILNKAVEEHPSESRAEKAKLSFELRPLRNKLIEESGVLKDKVNWRSRRVPAKDAHLLSLANLKDIATAIHLGIARGPKALDRQVIGQPENQQKLQKQLLEFFDEFLPSCRTHYGFLENPINPRAGVLQSKQASYALNPLIIRLFANTWARWMELPGTLPAQQLADHIGSLNLNLASPENDVQKTLQLVNDKHRLQGLRHRAWDDATRTILKAARE